MTAADAEKNGPESNLRRRNRILAWILVLVIVGMAVWGTLFLRHYGFNTDQHSERYH